MPDPYERPKLVPTFDPGAEIKLLWFGSQSSFKFLPLLEVWQRLEAEIDNYRYAMISSKTGRLLSKMTLRANKGAVTGVNFSRLDMHDWTWELQGQLLQDCDIVLMPVQTENPRTDTKSANRVIDSLISGKFVITTPLASYEEFAPYTWQGDYIEGIKWARDNPDQVINMIAAGQQYTEQNYSARVLSKQLIDEVERQLNSKET
jgi:glycosyltransferase involved in cell wall biosynthesis